MSADEKVDVRDDTCVYTYTGRDDSDVPRDATRVRVCPSVKVIAAGAFSDCPLIEEVELGDGLKEIGEKSFLNCESLQRIEIPSSVGVIKKKAFQGCERLGHVGLCEGLELIGPAAFARCISLKAIWIPSTVKSICMGSFANCKQLTDVELREGFACIGDSAFAGCKSMKYLKIPSSVRSIDKLAFFGCGQLEEVQLCEGLKCIKSRTFSGCKSLKRIVVPSSVKAIEGEAFKYCDQLVEVILCDGLQRIGESAFDCCKSLKCIDIPATVKEIRKTAFLRCYRLDKLEVREGLERVGEGAFGHCKALRCIKIPASAVINQRAFYGCQHLMSVEMFYGPLRIEKSAFQNCPSLRNIANPSLSCGSTRFGEGCHDLLMLFGSRKKIFEAVNTRFHGLPVHKHCHHQSLFCSSDARMKRIRHALDQPSSKNRLSPNQSNNVAAQDCLGFTPLHILACSTTHRQDLYEYIVAKYPKSLVTEDRWGCLPILYAIWSDAPQEIVQFLIDSQKAAFSHHILKWDEMMKTLCRSGASIETVQFLLRIRQTTFPGQFINLETAARELTILCVVKCDSFGDFHWNWKDMMEALGAQEMHQELIENLLRIEQTFFPNQNVSNWKSFLEGFVEPLGGWWCLINSHYVLRTFEFLVKCRVSERLSNIGIGTWRADFQSLLQTHCLGPRGPEAAPYDIIHSKLVSYESEYGRLKESTSLIELALWKCKAKEIDQIGRNTADKKNARVNCGAAVVIPNVFPFVVDV